MTCRLLELLVLGVFWISFVVVPLVIRGTTCRRYPARCEHSAGSQSCACSSCIGSSLHRRPGHQSRWPSLRSCCRSGCSCTCSCYRSTSHRPGAAGWRPSRGACRRCCSESSQCAICCPLCSVSERRWKIRGAVGGKGQHTELKGLAFLEDLGVVSASAGEVERGAVYLSTPLARVHDIVLVAVLVEQRLWVATGGVHGAP